MTTTGPREASFHKDPDYLRLREHYAEMPLALYTGAGASISRNECGIGDWDELLDSAAEALLPEEVDRYRDEVRGWSGARPWDQAQWLADRVGADELRQQLALLVRRKGNFQEAYTGLLTTRFLRGADTLRALSAFCASLVGFSRGKDDSYYGRVVPNPRVPAIVSTNYDPFLEAAASLMFRTLTKRFLLKPVGAHGSSAGSRDQVPVFHVHGYVQPASEETETRIPFVDPVLTRGDYEKAWVDTAYSATIGPQIHVLRHYATLFVGFSFRDSWVNDLLADLNRERAGRDDRLYHYALLPIGEIDARPEGWFEDHGLRPIGWEDPRDIVALLGDLYTAGVRSDMSRLGPVELVEYRPRTSPVRPTGKRVRIAEDDAGYLWDTLLASNLGRMRSAPPSRRR